MTDRFDKRKKDVLSKSDKSHKSEWDEKIKKLCDKINAEKRYYTTSSCSGRAVLMVEQDKKAEGLFISVYHNEVSFKQLKEDLAIALKKNQNIKFKLEPCILHVSCKTLENAQEIYNKAKLAGWKKSGIIGMKNGFNVELNGTDRLEFPIIQEGKVLVDDEFLKIIIEETGKKLEKNWIKIKKLEELINRKI